MKIKTPLLLALLAFSLSPLSTQAAEKILVADIAKAYKAYWKSQAAEKQLERSAEKSQQELQEMLSKAQAKVEAVKKIEQEYTSEAISKKRKAAIEATLREKIKDIREAEANINRFRKETEADLSKRRRAIVQSMAQDISLVINTIAKKENADFVLNISTNAFVIYHKPSKDITEQLIKELNSNQPKR